MRKILVLFILMVIGIKCFAIDTPIIAASASSTVTPILVDQYADSLQHISISSLSSTQKTKVLKRLIYLASIDDHNKTTVINLDSLSRIQDSLALLAKQEHQNSDIQLLKSLGYNADGLQEDYERLFAKPDWFGADWRTVAINYYTIAPGDIEAFIALARRKRPDIFQQYK